MSNSQQFSNGRRAGKAVERSNFVQTCNLLAQYIKEKGSFKDLNLQIGGKKESLESIVKLGQSQAAPSVSKSLSANSDGKVQTPAEPETSLNSFPRHAVAGSYSVSDDASNKSSTSKEAAKESKNAQLTIFYAGKVLVFDDYPAEKARELVLLATKESFDRDNSISSAPSKEKINPGLPPPSSSASKEKSNNVFGIQASSSGTKEQVNPAVAVASSSGTKEQPRPQTEANGADLPIARRSSLHRFLEKRKDRATARGPYHFQEQEQPASSKGDENLELKL